jgi:septal ring factor EnvC (AmiA/AmiB activator)
MSADNGHQRDSLQDSYATVVRLLDHITTEIRSLKGEVKSLNAEVNKLRGEFADHRKDDSEALSDIGSTLKEVASEAKEARLQADRVETAHDADIAGRAGQGLALQAKLAAEHIAASTDKRQATLKIVVAIVLALLTGAGGGKVFNDTVLEPPKSGGH